MIRLKNLLEAKQVGDIYHFTPLSNVSKIIKSQYMIPNDEQQVSATRWADMSVAGFQDMKNKSVARFMFDGNKLSNNFQIRPFSYNPNGSGGDDDEYEKLGEEQIVVNGRNFYFMPYLKRIDIFVQKGNPDLSKVTQLLNQLNILYAVYQGNPRNSIPYTQTKEGDPTQINYTAKPKEIYVTTSTAQNPYGPFKKYKFSNNPTTYPLKDDPDGNLMPYKQYKHRHPMIFDKIWNLSNMFSEYYVTYSDKFGFDYDKNIDLFVDSEKQGFGDKFTFGFKFNDNVTKYIIDNMLYKSWKELGLQDKVSNEISKIISYIPTADRIQNGGLIMLPKSIANKYLIANEVKTSYDYGKWVTPKKSTTTKYDWSGIDTPGDPNM